MSAGLRSALTAKGGLRRHRGFDTTQTRFASGSSCCKELP
jgi:hypothetical protein